MTPQLRFPEFADAWQVKRLGDTLDIGSGRDYKHLKSGDIPVYGTGGLMTHVDDYLYDGDSVAIGRKGTIDQPQFLTGKFWTVDTLFYTHNYRESTPQFIYALFQNINWRKWNEASGVPSLSSSTIKSIKVGIPTKPEQEKITDFLTAVDERIAVGKRQCEQLARYKRGVMQQIFSQKIRFKNSDGNSYPDWQFKKLGDVGDIIGGGTPDTTNPNNWSGDIPWLTPTEVKQKYITSSIKKITINGLKNSSATMLPIGSVIFTSRATVGDVAISNIELSTNQGFQSVVVNKTNSNQFLYYWIKQNKNEFLRRANGSTFPEISKREMKKIKISLPNAKEQQKIANFLTTLDDRITAAQTTVTAAKQFKKALLQRMFV